ncbi:MAG: M20/M25/M40 family metallo-hydrolase [Bacteroidetes bacterium]|nr:M20/M25/M40 family metallo-hydrolase [Bacteroidota bacterium]
MKCIALLFVGLLSAFSCKAQNDSAVFASVFKEALTHGECYSRLGELCKTIGSRLSGSDNAEKAVAWGLNMLSSYHFDTVFTQPVMVPRWERSNTELLTLSSAVLYKKLKKGVASNYNCEAFEESTRVSRRFRLPAVALGGTVGTAGKLSASVVSVHTDAELDSLGKSGMLRGKMVLLNRAFPEENLNTFASYGACVSQRVWGASRCAVYGAAAVLVRSMSNRCDLHAHTGVMLYADSVRKIPAMAVATAVADMLDQLITEDPRMKITMELGCRTLPDRQSANVIAASTGTVYPAKIIAFGGHFDSWDQGEGAHDDGAGCMHAFEALRILKAIGYKPRHTLCCVWWMNEENGLRGATEYAAVASANRESHVAALESDRGGFTPRGFGVDTAILSRILPFKPLLEKYGIGTLENGGGGADIGPLKKYNPSTVLISFIPDSQRYFDVHHAETDVFENVNKRELELGAAAVAAMIYILDQELE